MDNIFNSREITILNVDDSAANRYIRTRLLRCADYRLIEAATGRETLRLTRVHRPHLVILDVHLPDMDGFEVCRTIKKDPETKSTMVLLVSASCVAMKDKILGLEEGADGYLIEPIEPEEFLATIKALLRLYHSEQRLALALTATTDVVWDWDAVADRLLWSQAGADRFGWSEIVDQSQPGGWWRERVHPEDRSRVSDRLSASIQEPSASHWSDEYRIRQADGCYAWVMDRASVIRDESGTVMRMVGAMQDVTATRSAVRALRDSEERLRLALSMGAMGSWDWNVLTGDVHCSPSYYSLLGLPPNEVQPSYECWTSPVHPDDLREVETILRHTMQAHEECRADFRVIWPDGTIHWMAGRGRYDYDSEGRCTRMIGVITDITERKQTQEHLQRWASELQEAVRLRTMELVQSQERLRALAADLTLTEQRERKRLATDLHDYLAQLLVVLRMKLRQAMPLVLDQKAAGLLKDADQVLTQALEYTRTLVAELAPSTLNEFGLLPSVEWLASQMRQHGLEVEIHPATETISLPEDQAILLFQSVRELLYNVLKHAQTDTATVSFRLTPDRELHIAVEDHGCGLDVSTLDQHSPTSAGFGLFNLKERMAIMGGRLSIDSEIAHGTRVSLQLPYRPTRSCTDSMNGSYQMPESSNRVHYENSLQSPLHQQDTCEKTRIRVLLVDDHAMVRQGLRSVLESYSDIEVVGEAADGNESLVSIERMRPSVVVMDLNMPKMNGIEATAIIKSRYPEIVILGLSVNASADNLAAMMKAGASALLTKEAAVDDLYDTIHEAIAATS